MTTGTLPADRGRLSRSFRDRLREPDFWPKWGVPLGFIAMCIYFATQSPVFFTVGNFATIFQQASITGIAAIGATIVLLGGNLDISQGSVMAIAGVVAVKLLNSGVPVFLVIPAALAVGLAAGALISFLVITLRVPSFIASLGAMLSVRGLAFVVTAGISTGLTAGIAPAIVTLGQGRIGEIPVPAILMVVLFLIFALLMTQTVWGVRIAALGSSEDATRLAGVRPAGIVYSTFMVAGALSAVAGLLLVGRLTSAAPQTATGIEFDILTAVVLGGASIYGGKASVLRTLLGAIFVVTLYNGMLLLGVPSFFQMMANGLALVAALALNQFGTRVGR
jgi:ribose/xylose/arabinose/galactoside ABC-type transport system permease subunit